MEKAAAPTQGTAAGCKPLTTFVQTDTHTFREVVQRLTGPSDHQVSKSNNSSTNPAATDHVAANNSNSNSKMMMSMGTGTGTVTSSSVKRTSSKLHERRQCMRPKLEIVKPTFYFKPAEHHQCFSPPSTPSSGFLTSPVGTPSSIISKLSIQEDKTESKAALVPELNSHEEEKAIKERRFYLHPSPRARQGRGDTTPVPELLTLFPLTSPRDATA